MVTRKIYLTIIINLLLVGAVMAQLDIRLTGAYGNMSLEPTTGLNINIEPGKFTTVGLQADYYITDKLGLGIGADYYLVDSKFDVILSDYSHVHKGVDNWEGDPIPREYEFTIRSNSSAIDENNYMSIADIVEQNTMSFVEIPISVIYSFPLINNIKLATRLGAKVGIPLSGDYVLNESDLYTRLYFEVWDLELFEIPAHGLYDSRTDWHPEGELDLNMVYSVFTEIGLDFPVSLFNVRVSGYFSYGLNDMIAEKETSLIYWREEYNSILTLPQSVNHMQYGVKIGIGINRDRNTTSAGAKYRKRSNCNCGGAWY